MGLWDDKDPRHDDFPIYVGELPGNQSYSKIVFRASSGKMNVNECMNEFIDKLKSEGFDAVFNVRVAGGNVHTIYCNAVKF